MREKPTAEYIRSALDYDPDTGLFRWRRRSDKKLNWNAENVGKVAGYVASEGYIRIKVNRVEYPAHRLAYLYMTGDWPINEVDHINAIKSDNRWTNLRDATGAQNCQNRAAPNMNNKCGFIGVSFRSNRWRANIFVDGKQKWLGSFPTAEEAAAAYDNAAIQYRGQFARTNLAGK